MHESGVNYEEVVNYNLLFCHACLSSNRTLSAVGEYIDIYLKICDNSHMSLTSQVNVCWECLALLKKVHSFRRKVENAQRILDYCLRKQVPLEDNLSNLTLSSTETTIFDYYPIFKDENADENEKYLEKPDKDTHIDKAGGRAMDDLFEKDVLMFKIEDVRGRCDIVDEKPILDLSANYDVAVKAEPPTPTAEERRHHCWKRSVLLVLKRLCGHRYSHHFRRPVSDELAPLYSRIVRRPTDLSTIKRRIKDGVIRTTAELTRALLLMFSNALMYNSSEDKIYQKTLEFREETLRELSLLVAAQTDSTSPVASELRRRPTLSPPLCIRDYSQNPAAGLESRKSPGSSSTTQSVKSLTHGSKSCVKRRKPAPELIKFLKSTYNLKSRKSTREPVRSPTHGPSSVKSKSRELVPVSSGTPREHAPASARPPRRASVCGNSLQVSNFPDEMKAAAPRARRRASVWAPEPPPHERRAHTWAPEPPAAAHKRRARWDWPCLDNDQYLVANCFKKCKSTVLL